MGAEACPLFGNFRQVLQAENLETATVGENRPLPVHEPVQTAETADKFMTGPEIEVVGVAEDDLRPDFDQILRRHRLD